MKKMLAILLSLAMALACAGAFAEDYEVSDKVAIGTISINGAFTLKCGLPEGYTITPITADRDQITAMLASEDDTKPVMVLSVAFDEAYADVERMNDLDEEAFAVLEQSFIDMDPTVEISYGDTGLGTRLLIAMQTAGEQDYIDFLSIYKGYLVEFVLVAPMNAEDRNLTEDQLRMCIDFLTDLDFVPAPMPEEVPVVEEGTYTANLSDYDPESNTLKAALTRVIVLDPALLETLKVGDILDIGSESVTVEKLEKFDDGDIAVNDDIVLGVYDGEVHASMNEKDYTEVFATLTLQVPETLLFLDGIDPATGDILDTPTEHSAKEFIAMLSSGEYPDFSSDNVRITLDENGELAVVERFYTPWQ